MACPRSCLEARLRSCLEAFCGERSSRQVVIRLPCGATASAAIGGRADARPAGPAEVALSERVVNLQVWRETAQALRAAQFDQRGLTITRSFTWSIATPGHTPNGPARNCPWKRNGSSPPAAGWTVLSSPGAASPRRGATPWPTLGRVDFPRKTSRSTATSAHLRSRPSRRMARPLRQDRKHWGMDHRLVVDEARIRSPQGCCTLANPRGGPEAASYEIASPQSARGRFALCAPKLLTPLPAGGELRTAD
jgi:hypothetical protein